MAELTNTMGIPDIMVEVLHDSPHELGSSEFSITQLIKPPRILQLERRHASEIQRDAADMWNSFIGQCVHGGVYKKIKDNENYIVEKRLEIDINGVTVGGTPDLYDKNTCTLFDHKTMQTSAFGLEAKPEYEAQLNIYGYMLEGQGNPVHNLMINAIYLDWRKSALRFADQDKYPATPTKLVPVRKWSAEEVEQYLEARVSLHKDAEKLSDEELPTCTPEETWETPSKWVAYRPGGLRALKVEDRIEDLESWLKWKKIPMKDVLISQRPGTCRRCEMYCGAAPFCNQYRGWLEAHK
jgi:hypothetical protein